MAVYFIQAADDPVGPVKIGRASDPKARLNSLQGAHHSPLRILRTIEEGEAAAELWLHKYYADRRLNGEWFQYDASMLAIEAPLEETTDLSVALRDLGMSQREFAQKVGYRHESISRYVRGHAKLPAALRMIVTYMLKQRDSSNG